MSVMRTLTWTGAEASLFGTSRIESYIRVEFKPSRISQYYGHTTDKDAILDQGSSATSVEMLETSPSLRYVSYVVGSRSRIRWFASHSSR